MLWNRVSEQLGVRGSPKWQQKFRQKFRQHFRKWDIFSKKNVKNHDFEGSVEKNKGSRDPKLFFIECALVSAQTWWTTLKTCGACIARYGVILQHMEPKITILSHFLGKLVKFTRFQRPTGRCAGVRNFWNSKIKHNRPIEGCNPTKNFDRNFWQKFRQHFRKWDKISRFLKTFENWNQDIKIFRSGSMCWKLFFGCAVQ